MTSQPKISIIVPVYNTERFLRECLDSLLSQTFPVSDYEVVAVNDGSTDDSLAILRSYQLRHANLMVHDRPHAGVSAAVEYGVLMSRSEWLAFTDSDDWLEADFLETMYRHVACPDCDLIIAHMVLHLPKGAVIYRCSSLEPGFYEKSRFADRVYPGLIYMTKNQSQYTVGVSRSSKLIRRRLVLKALPYCVGLEYIEDKVLVVSSTLGSKGINVLDGYYPYHYRLNYKSADMKAMYPRFRASAGAIGRIVGDAGGYDFTYQIKSFLLLGLICDVNKVVKTVTPWNRAALSRRLKELYSQGRDDGILSCDESSLSLHWWLVKHGLIWALSCLKLITILKRELQKCAYILIKKSAAVVAHAFAPVRKTA